MRQGPAPVAPLVLLLADQEVVERRGGFEPPGLFTFATRPGRVAGPLQASGPAEVIGPRRGMERRRPVEDRQPPLGRIGRPGQDQEQLVAALGDLGPLLCRQACREGAQGPGVAMAGRREAIERGLGRLAGRLLVAGEVEPGELGLVEQGCLAVLEELLDSAGGPGSPLPARRGPRQPARSGPRPGRGGRPAGPPCGSRCGGWSGLPGPRSTASAPGGPGSRRASGRTGSADR